VQVAILAWRVKGDRGSLDSDRNDATRGTGRAFESAESSAALVQFSLVTGSGDIPVAPLALTLVPLERLFGQLMSALF
jgi:hypothetical protein